MSKLGLPRGVLSYFAQFGLTARDPVFYASLSVSITVRANHVHPSMHPAALSLLCRFLHAVVSVRHHFVYAMKYTM